MPNITPPESLQSERERAKARGRLSEEFAVITGEDLDVRLVDPVDWHNPVPRNGLLYAWMKTTAALDDDPAIHRTLLTYFSDTMLLDAGLIQHGRSYWDRQLQVASLDHSIWFHEDFRADEWLLHSAELERNSGGRTLVRGRFYTREGRQVATIMQQGLMRKR